MANAWGVSFGPAWGVSWGTSSLGRRRRTKFWTEDPTEWKKPEQLSAEEVRIELVSLIDTREGLRNTLKASVGENLRSERARISKDLEALNREIARYKQELRRQESEAQKVIEARLKEQEELMAKLKREQEEEEEMIEVVNFVMGIYE